MSEAPRHRLTIQIGLQLDRFDLEVDVRTTEHVTGVFGASGSGKTSLLEAVAGLRRNARGRIALGDDVWLDTESGTFRKPETRHIGYVPQDGRLFPNHDVRQNLLAGAARARREGHPLDETFATVTDLLELGPLLDRRVTTLSGGERQRVSLGRALCSGPRLLLLDEPLASLDIPLRRRVLPFLRRVRDEFDLPMLLVSHDPVEVQALCDDLVVLREGRVIARGAPARVLTDPEVFPLAEKEGYENVLPCRLVESLADTSVVRLGDGPDGPTLITPPAGGEKGDKKLVGIPAREVILATSEPRGISAQNVLRATVRSIDPIGSLRLVRASVGEDIPDIAVEVTEQASSDLSLRPGCTTFLILKTAGCLMYDPSARD